MTATWKLPGVVAFHHQVLSAWWRERVPAGTADLLVRLAFRDQLWAAINGMQPGNGPYVSGFNFAYYHAGDVAPEVIHGLGAGWRRDIPLPAPADAAALIEAYCVVHSLAMTWGATTYDALHLSALPLYMDGEGRITRGQVAELRLPARLDLMLLHVQNSISSFEESWLMQPPDIRRLQRTLRERHYSWVEMQHQIRQEAASGHDEQDHGPSATDKQGPDGERQYHGPVGKDHAGGDDHPPQEPDAHRPDLA